MTFAFKTYSNNATTSDLVKHWWYGMAWVECSHYSCNDELKEKTSTPVNALIFHPPPSEINGVPHRRSQKRREDMRYLTGPQSKAPHLHTLCWLKWVHLITLNRVFFSKFFENVLSKIFHRTQIQNCHVYEKAGSNWRVSFIQTIDALKNVNYL